jgi:23S rRNA-/tRNA-specific pseudouridylate synthase
MQPIRLRILLDDGECMALEKPAGVLIQQDNWYPRTPVLIEAIRYQAEGGKPEFERRKIGKSGLWAVHDLDPEVHGPVLLCRSREYAESLKESLGCGGFRFLFQILVRALPFTEPLECDLPLARHRTERQMLVSHATGKQAHTRFELESSHGQLQVVNAFTRFPRRHQILLHASEVGLPVIGDRLYSLQPLPMLSSLKRSYRASRSRDEKPLYPGPACILKGIELPSGVQLSCPIAPKWKALLKQLEKAIS